MASRALVSAIWGASRASNSLSTAAAAADLRLIDSLDPAADPALRLQRFGRSACLGGMAGSVAMGLAGELLGLGGVLPLQLLAFLAAAAGLPRLVPPR